MQLLVGVLGAVLGALVGGVVAYFSTRSRIRLEVEYAHDQTLRDKRLEHYQRLFHISRCLPRYWRAVEQPARTELLTFREEFHNWYFGEQAGGLFLTPRSKALYLELQNALWAAARPDQDQEDQAVSELSAEESRRLRTLASELRHQLAEDVGAAHPPRLRWTRLGPTAPPSMLEKVDPTEDRGQSRV
ncbi:hypothetical protein [Kutzneria sp. CA-103260]|uniref:hypothetical protein n=1 Tax=Kutzneria sp. CA-103260 TaxID=2802641 RepID=UPI001BAA9FEE|nr:hypothetical protein [Kutzneria sp. CA-103260]QUQ69490.1 hypothetical protein JJ691_72480 [Kutzneria sp. CA-103260]